jgi:hypothetical protein
MRELVLQAADAGAASALEVPRQRDFLVFELRSADNRQIYANTKLNSSQAEEAQRPPHDSIVNG